MQVYSRYILQQIDSRAAKLAALLRVSKKPPIVKMQDFDTWRFSSKKNEAWNKRMRFKKPAKARYAKHFDLLRKPSSTVPMYADELGLLVLAELLNSASLSKNKFFDRLSRAAKLAALLKLYLQL